MADEFKSIRDSLFRALMGNFDDIDESDADAPRTGRLDSSTTKALLSAIFARAGKGKDEVVQIVAREIGVAVAAMLKEPLAQLADKQKLQISFEFVPKAVMGSPSENVAKAHRPPKPGAKSKKRRSKAS